jgi:hypothetical protein
VSGQNITFLSLGILELAWLLSRTRDRCHFRAVGAAVLLAWTPTTLLGLRHLVLETGVCLAVTFAVTPGMVSGVLGCSLNSS